MKFEKKYLHILTKEALEEAYAELGTMKSVGDKFGIDDNVICQYMKYYGIDYKKKIVYICDESVFDNDNEDSFYWAGFMAADGNVSKDNDICITLATKDINHLEKFKQFLKSDSPITTRITQRDEIAGRKLKNNKLSSSRFRIRNHHLAESLKRFGVVQNKTKIYSIPKEILNSPYFKDFLRGYFDGDGWYSETFIRYKDKKYPSISWGICGNYETVINIKNKIYELLNITGSMHKQKNIYKFRIGNQHSVYLLSKFLYDNINYYLDRKYEISKKTEFYDQGTVRMNFTKEQLNNLLNECGSQKAIAEKLNCSRSVINKYFKRFELS